MSIMTPSSPSGIIYQALIQNNCHVFLGPDVEIDIISQLDSSGTYTAHVLKTERGKRSPVLSASSATLGTAFEQLQEKSARAVDHYVTANGFALPPRLTSRASRRGGGRNAVSVIGDTSASSSSDTEASDSDDRSSGWHQKAARRGIVHGAVKSGEQRPRQPGHHPAHRQRHSQHEPSVAPFPAPPFSAPYRPLAPPPPVGVWPASMGQGARATFPPPPPPPPPGWAANGRPGFPTQPGMPPNPIPAPWKSTPRMADMVLCLEWMGGGSKLNLLDQCPLSKAAICQRAMTVAQARPLDFKPHILLEGPGDRTPARVTIKRLRIGKEVYEMGGFRDDLSALVVGSPHMPQSCLTVDIELYPAYLTHKPMPPPPSQVDSSDEIVDL